MTSASTTTREPGVRALNVQRTRRRLSVEGIRLIERQGFTRTTVDQIAEAAEVSQRTFFRYFPCKEALLFGGDRSYDHELSRLEFPPDGETLGQSLRHMAVSWESHGDAHQQRRRRLRFELQDAHPSIGLYLDDVLRRLEPQVIGAAARRLRVDATTDLRPLVVAQLHTALCRLVVRRPPGDQTGFLDRWFDAAARVLRDIHDA
ncbi:MAG TPA: TetR family transcriptional regulator [Pseudonocardia sp.]|nr:TetR family transcriptional regulator [Pseudonocardia sp.]